jgi:poly-gamma-glutamate synthesis protein (capsule biosynthesis protein)
MKKFLPWLIFILFSLLVTISLLTEINRFPAASVVEVKPRQEQIRVILVGDIMLDRGVEYMVEKEGSGNFKFPFWKIADYLEKADVLFGNLESPISDKGEKIGSIYSFRTEPEAIDGLTFAGFDVLSVANNHAFDYGWEALEDTLRRLKEAGIDYIGIDSPVIKEVNGSTGSPLRIAFLAYTNLGLPSWGIGWADWNNLEEIKKEIQETKQKADILIVSLHAGEEYQKTPNQFQIDFAKMAVDAGADLVVGHHSHVIQPNEEYPSTNSGQVGYIFYGLGNFVFDQGFSEETMKGQILEISIENGKIKKINPREIKINKYFQPILTNGEI